MIDERSPNATGFARFSDDRVFRYRLARSLTSRAIDYGDKVQLGAPHLRRVVFVMLNPSTADAFKLDPTVRKCVQFAELWKADVLEVVNLFAYRSTYPEDLYRRVTSCKAIVGETDVENDTAILAACAGAARVIAAWGMHGQLLGRGDDVRELLTIAGVRLEALKLTSQGRQPSHPLARGKAFIPLTTEPQPWP